MNDRQGYWNRMLQATKTNCSSSLNNTLLFAYPTDLIQKWTTIFCVAWWVTLVV